MLDEGLIADFRGEGSTPLIKAAEGGNSRCVEVLLERGATVDREDEHTGRTPLGYAAEYGKVECVRVLLAHGADAARGDRSGNTPLELALLNRHIECIRLLPGGENVQLSAH